MLKVLFHIGAILQVLKDAEQVAVDIAHSQPMGDDARKAIVDLMALLESGVIEIPGLSTDELRSVLTQLEQLIPAAK